MKGFGKQGKSKKKKISNKNNNISKEQIINKAINLHLQGNTSEATVYYKQLINQECNDHRVFSNYGIILRGHEKLQEAEIYTRKAIELNPHFLEAHLNLGTILKDLGNLKEAEIYTRKVIELNPHFAEAYSNLGNILRDLGNLKEAEIYIRKAIELNPHFAEAHSNLGNTLKDLGKLQEAEISQRKAIKLNPNFANAHLNLGNILSDLGKLKEAEISQRKAIELNPNFANAHLHLGTILKDLGKPKDAFESYIKVIEINPKDSNIYPAITKFLSDSDLSELNQSKLKNILNLLLARNDISHTDLFKAFNFLYCSEIIRNLEKFDSDSFNIDLFMKDKLIIDALKKIIFKDSKLEKLLTKIRENMCNLISINIEIVNQFQLEFIIALGEQCFLNEYVYLLTNEEKISISQIINKCRDGALNETHISILACYLPLYKVLDQIPSLKSFNSSYESFKELLKLQILEPLTEIELSRSIRQFGEINDYISQKVKSQYEENPYPRWRYGKYSKGHKISLSQAINNEINPNFISQDEGKQISQILIAGCGTGNQILQAQRYINAQVTAIDLSLSSLSYAQRKINELDIDNVELIQMDILEVPLLKQKFDIIECSGVLHHMNDPLKGLETLLNTLKENGFLKLGLYSELSRKDIVKARNYIDSKKLKSNKNDLRDFRKIVFSGQVKEINSLTNSPDFYTLSSCRDLCFHAKEYRFTIKQLQEILRFNDLKFLGFILPKSAKTLYEKYFPEDKEQTNLQNWARFEEKFTNTFSGMYQFWVCKTKI